MSRHTFGAVIGVLLSLPTAVLAQYFSPRTQDALSTAPAAIVMEKDASGRPAQVIDRAGTLNVLVYDAAGRLLTVTQPAQRRAVVIQYDAGNRAEGYTVLDLTNGREVKSFHRHQKYLEADDPEFPGLIDDINTTDDPWAWYFDAWADRKPPDPPQCSIDDCNSACDAAFGMSGLACAAFTVASAPAGMICGAAALAAWASCRQKCSANCY